MWLLGISAYYHDSAAALIRDDVIVAAAQEERFNRQKNFAGFPAEAVRYCLQEGGIAMGDIESIVFYEKPLLRFERLLETYLAFAPHGITSFLRSMPLWLTEKLFQKRMLTRELQALQPGLDIPSRLRFTEHHLSHAASAFYPSPYERALILVMDGVGEWASTSVMIGEGANIRPVREIVFPHSLGMLYSAFTSYCGFRVNDGEYKLMGLAPYGEPRYAEKIRQHLLDLRGDGSFGLDMRYFDFCTGLTMTNHRFHWLFGREPRREDAPITQLDMDLAASIQQVTEEVIRGIATALRREFDVDYLCLAGGVALNCVANGKLVKSGLFKGVWIQPAAGDAGGAVGAALAAYHLHHRQPRPRPGGGDAMQGAYLGPAFSDDQIEQVLAAAPDIRYEVLVEEDLIEQAARSLAEGKVIGWFQGRMEFGPRALGARSILGDPRAPGMQSLINQKIKFRESFRPFAPSVLREDLKEYFDLDTDSPYMLLVAQVKPAHGRMLSDIPAVTHVDNSARIQTVTPEHQPRYYRLIRQFKEITGVGMLVNTSFNVRDQPIVCTPQDAVACFLDTALDELFIGRYKVIRK